MKASTASPRSSEVGLLVALLAAAAAIRVFLALTTPGWFAEIYIVRVAALPFREALRLTSADIHPPLQFLLRCAWTDLAGASVISHKLLSVLFALACTGILCFAQ